MNILVFSWNYYPIKIKLTPNYKIDWNEEVEEVNLTIRETYEVKLFNMKQFVKKEEKSLDEIIKEIDLKIEELDSEDNKKTIIEEKVRKVEIEKDRVIIYFK